MCKKRVETHNLHNLYLKKKHDFLQDSGSLVCFFNILQALKLSKSYWFLCSQNLEFLPSLVKYADVQKAETYIQLHHFVDF